MSPPTAKEISKAKGYETKRRHIFLCTNGKCCQKDKSEALYEFLKTELSIREPDGSKATVLRTKSGCLRICAEGPIALVYPEGTLYANLDEAKLMRVIDEHLFGGKPVTDFVIQQSPLSDQ